RSRGSRRDTAPSFPRDGSSADVRLRLDPPVLHGVSQAIVCVVFGFEACRILPRVEHRPIKVRLRLKHDAVILMLDSHYAAFHPPTVSPFNSPPPLGRYRLDNHRQIPI